MTSQSADLLRLLSPVGRPPPSASASARPGSAGAAGPGAGIEHASFADLLRRAESGDFASGIPVKVDEHAGVTLTEEQIARLSIAADKAEAAGIHKALVLIDGQSLLLDVHTRTVTGKADLGGGAPASPGSNTAKSGAAVGGGAVLAGIDGVLNLGGGPEAANTSPILKAVGALPSNASITQILARLAKPA